jgi:hypothetical protein
MFTRNRSDMVATIGAMIERAVPHCKYDQNAAQGQVAAWVKQDRRFDNIGMSATEIAKEAFDARATGRQMRLGPKPIELNPLPQTYTGR